MKRSDVEQVLGYPVFHGGPEECVAEILEWIAQGERVRWLACLNPHSYAAALRSPRFDAALRDAEWLIPDGAGVVLASRLLGGRMRRRVTGSDVFAGVTAGLQERGGGRVFLLGSTEATLSRMREKIEREYPLVQVVGVYSPPFKVEYSQDELDEMVAAVTAARPDVVWVGMTAPKQEVWIHSVRDRLDARFVAGVGAVFDFYVGRIKRPPALFQRLGLEWLPRLLQEPRRLWRRTFVSAPIFLAHVLRERLRRVTKARSP